MSRTVIGEVDQSSGSRGGAWGTLRGLPSRGPPREVVVPKRAAYQFGAVFDRLIAGGMPITVMHAFEVIDV